MLGEAILKAPNFVFEKVYDLVHFERGEGYRVAASVEVKLACPIRDKATQKVDFVLIAR
jgi:hypothetical protein